MSAPQGRVRPMATADLDRVRAWRNHADVRRYMYTQHEIGADEHRAWFERASRDPDRCLLVFELDGVASGFVNFGIRRAEGVADWGFYLAPEAPKGSGSALGQAALAFAFRELKVRKVCGEAMAANERSVRFHLRLGFREEGRLRKQGHDVICFGLRAEEFR